MSDYSEPNSKELRVIEAMENDSQLPPEEWQEIMNDPSSLLLCRDILDASYVLAMDQAPSSAPFDVNKELAAFKQKKRKQRIKLYLRTVTSIAATFIIGVLGYFIAMSPSAQSVIQEPVLVFQADEKPQSILLDKGDGHQLPIHTREVNLATSQVTASTNTPAAHKVETLKPHTLTIPKGETFKITLCDGTEVWLNANSYFVYPTAFIGKERVVTLKGEAYFKVTPNAKQPFIVKTPDIETRVLGTEFNLRNYSPEDTHVVLIEGKVEVRSTAAENAYTSLLPGEDAHLQPDGNFIMSEVNTDPYTYWKDGYFYFDQTELKDIMEHIGRWYNVNIQFRNPYAMHHKMHFIASREEPLEQTLKLLNRMKKVTASLHGNTVTID